MKIKQNCLFTWLNLFVALEINFKLSFDQRTAESDLRNPDVARIFQSDRNENADCAYVF